jgi:hypothetical protein
LDETFDKLSDRGCSNQHLSHFLLGQHHPSPCLDSNGSRPQRLVDLPLLVPARTDARKADRSNKQKD